jgi:hypothetical protein
MLTAVFGIFLNFLLFFLIGFWPTFWFSSSKNRLLTALAIAPTTGFAITSIAATYLILMDFPVKDWSSTYVVVCSAVSLLILLHYTINHGFRFGELIVREQGLLWLTAGFVIAAVIVVLPMLLGGFRFTLFRGNAEDSFNYMVMAEYLDHKPLSWQNTSFFAEALQKNQLYSLSKHLLTTRWTTSAVLAFSARAANVPINQFEYSYSVLFFIIALGPAFAFAKRLRLDSMKALIVALIICAGYWAQFVLDTRAFSQITSMPLLLAVCCAIPSVFSRSRGGHFKEPILWGILGASLVFSYPEIIPLCALSIFMFVVVLFLKRTLSADFVLYLGTALAVLVFICLPNLQFIVGFLSRQLMYAADASNNWHEFYYRWLYSDPILGVWGLSPFLMLRGLFATQYFGEMVQFLLALVGSVLTGLVFMSIVMVLKPKRVDPISILLISFACATIIQFLFLFVRQQWWTAGKALAFGYPFFLLLVTGIGWKKQISSFPPALVTAVNGFVWAWVVLQVVLFGARSINAVTQTEYANYLVHNENYRQHDFDLSSLQKVLDKSKPSNILIPIQDPASIRYLNLVFGWDHLVFSFLDVMNQGGDPTEKADGQYAAEFVILDKKQCETSAREVLAGNSEIVLMKYDHAKFICFYVSSPNGFDIVNNRKFYWLGNQETLIGIQSSFAGTITMVGDFTMGPSLPEKIERNLMVTSIMDGRSQSFNIAIRPGWNTIEIPVSRGKNTIELTVLDEPTIHSLPNGDPRILLLGLQDIQIRFQNELKKNEINERK